jgi:hypothetical protein
MFSSRKGPLLIAAGLFGGLLYMTAGGKQQPRPVARAEAGSNAPVSETLQAVAGTGGKGARDTQEVPGVDVKDGRLGTADPGAPSTRNPETVRGGGADS